jgi:hypothetical protein
MNRSTWNWFMIVLMGAVIVFSLQEIFRSPEPLNETRYLLGIGIAVLVIVLKLGEIKKASAETQKSSQG